MAVLEMQERVSEMTFLGGFIVGASTTVLFVVVVLMLWNIAKDS